MKLRYMFLTIYLVILASFAIYGFFCSFSYCQLFAFLVPATPWIQFAGFFDINLPQFLIVVPYIINASLVYFLGVGVEKLLKN
tara:strand:+ start:342 stop:590 length:249 start_codon:yes stop_codon:yes gene_type:complete